MKRYFALILLFNLSLNAGRYQEPLTKRHCFKVTLRRSEILAIPVQGQTDNTQARHQAGKILTKIENGGYPDSVKDWLRMLLDTRIAGRPAENLPERFFPFSLGTITKDDCLTNLNHCDQNTQQQALDMVVS